MQQNSAEPALEFEADLAHAADLLEAEVAVQLDREAEYVRPENLIGGRIDDDLRRGGLRSR